MAERRRGLGRGLGALIPSAPAAAPEAAAAEQVPPTPEEKTGVGAPAVEPAARTTTEAAGGVEASHPGRGSDDGANSAGTSRSSAKTTSRSRASAGRSGTGRKSSGTAKTGAAAKTDAADKANAAAKPAGAGRSGPEPKRSSAEKGAATAEAPEATRVSVSKAMPQVETFDLEALSGAERSPEADSVPRETPTPRRRTVSPEARQKAMRSRMDMSSALRSRAGADRPSDMFFSPSSTSGGTADTPDEAVDEREMTEERVEGDADVDVSRGTSTDPASTQDLAVVPGAVFAEVPVDDIHPNRKQPREVFDEDELAELAYSIGELGVLQPIVVRPSRETGGPRYELVMGERRWRATQRAELTTIPAIVRETADDDLLRDALLENLHRSQLNPLEEAAAYQQLLEEFGATQEELSRRIGRSRPQISNTLRLMKLPPLVQRRVAAGVLSAGHARALLALEDPAEMERLAQRIVAEGMSVRAAEEAASLAKRSTSTRRAGAQAQECHRERLDYIADAFADKLDTSVKINLGAKKGRMTIEFASVEDLNRIITVLDPQADTGDQDRGGSPDS